MSGKCFGIYYTFNDTNKYLTNLSKFNYFVRDKISTFMVAGAKELLDRSPDDSIFDLEVEIDELGKSAFTPYVVGTKNSMGSCIIFTFEERPHNHLIILSKFILYKGMKETIKENFEYISSELKCKEIQNELDNVKDIMVNNINLLLQRGEKLDDLIEKTEHLTIESKKFYKQSKKLNKRCCFFF